MSEGMLSLSWNNHRATFCHILATLREKERYTDVTVACDGKFYPVHKLVLSTCSEYFEKIFENTPCKHPVIVLKDVNRFDLEALFCYMYEGAVSVSQNNLGRLIKAAEVLRIKGLAVPDEPPISDGCCPRRPNTTDDRSSPHPKRRRRESNTNRTRSSPSPHASPRHSPTQDGECHPGDRSRGDGQWGDQTTGDREDGVDGIGDDRLGDVSRESHPASTPPQVEVMVDETLVKEEMIDQEDNGQEDNLMDSGMDYGSAGSDSRLEGSAGGGGDDDQLLPGKYETKANPSQQQQQAIPEAVVEALAGPSGMQTWLGGGEMPSGFTGLEGYPGGGGEGAQDLHQQPSQPPGPHQMVWRETNAQESESAGRLTQQDGQGNPSPPDNNNSKQPPPQQQPSCPQQPPTTTTATTTTTTTTSSSTTPSYASVYTPYPAVSPSVSISPHPSNSPPAFPTLMSPSHSTFHSSTFTSSCSQSGISGSLNMPPPSHPPSQQQQQQPLPRSINPAGRPPFRSRLHSHPSPHHNLDSPPQHPRPFSQPQYSPSSALFPSSPSPSTSMMSSLGQASGFETLVGDDKRVFSCEYCPYKTTRKTAMKEHINSHTGKKPHACPFCPYRTCWNSSMVVHMRTHTGEKPYPCPHCNYHATQRSSLKAHLLTHQTTATTTTTTTITTTTTPTTTTTTTTGLPLMVTVDSDDDADDPPVPTTATATRHLHSNPQHQSVHHTSTPSHITPNQDSLSPPTLYPQQYSQTTTTSSLNLNQQSSSSVPSLLPFQHTSPFLTPRHPTSSSLQSHHPTSSLFSHLSSAFPMPPSPSLAILQPNPSLQVPETPAIAISHIVSLSTPQSHSPTSPSFPH